MIDFILIVILALLFVFLISLIAHDTYAREQSKKLKNKIEGISSCYGKYAINWALDFAELCITDFPRAKFDYNISWNLEEKFFDYRELYIRTLGEIHNLAKDAIDCLKSNLAPEKSHGEHFTKENLDMLLNETMSHKDRLMVADVLIKNLDMVSSVKTLDEVCCQCNMLEREINEQISKLDGM